MVSRVGFTFLLWGLMHGVYLCINHAWRQWRPNWDKARYERVMTPLGFVLTFLAVAIAMVLFRARSVPAAGRMLHGMLGLDGISLPNAIMGRLGTLGSWLAHWGVSGDLGSGTGFVWSVLWLLALFLIATRAPNSLDLMRQFEPALHYVAPKPSGVTTRFGWPARITGLQLKLSMGWAAAMAFFFVLGSMGLNRISEFLYWQF